MRARGPLWTLQLAAGFAIASATSIPRNRIFERADTCAADFTKCTQSGLPANFCCKTGTTCNVLAGGTTVLCCPSGGNCTTIQTISCTLSLQDPTKNPTADVKTTELNGKLPTCGTGCCPFGYHCDDGNGNCVMDADQSKKPGQTSTTTSSGSPTSTATKGGTTHTSSAATSAATQSTSTGGANAGETAAPSTEGSTTAKKTLNTAAIVGGVVGGLLAISLLIAGFCLLRRKRRKSGDPTRTTSRAKKRETTQSFGHIITRDIISAPIPHEDYYNQRLDFLAKTQGSEASSTASPTLGRHEEQQRHEQHFPPQPSSPYSASVFRNSALTTAGVDGDGYHGRPRSHHASAEVGGLRNLTDRYSAGSLRNPFTPRGEHFHSGGSQSINIFADPSTVGSPSVYNPRDTTWTEFAGHHHAIDQEGLNSPLPPRK